MRRIAKPVQMRPSYAKLPSLRRIGRCIEHLFDNWPITSVYPAHVSSTLLISSPGNPPKPRPSAIRLSSCQERLALVVSFILSRSQPWQKLLTSSQ